MKIIYNILFAFFSIGYLPLFILKGKYRHGFAERFGVIAKRKVQDLKGEEVFWIHAVSVGEVSIALRCLKALKQKFPSFRYVLTVTTGTGYAVAEKGMDPMDTLLYFPVDFSFSIKNFIRRVGPKALLVMETEIWPNLVWELHRRRIPQFIVNGRISDKAYKRYLTTKFFWKKLLPLVTAIGTQDDEMRDRFISLGADAAKVSVTGNLKFDWEPPATTDPTAAQLGKLIADQKAFLLVAGSTHEGEEEALFRIYPTLKKTYPSLYLLIAPRHTERMARIELSAQSYGLKTVRVSAFEKEQALSDGKNILLLDRMGVLVSYYQIADLVFIGGSLVPRGGHNLAEPAYFGKPILVGPSTENFQQMTQIFLKEEAVIQVPDESILTQEILSLLGDLPKRKRLGLASRTLLAKHQGAVQKTLDLILQDPINHS